MDASIRSSFSLELIDFCQALIRTPSLSGQEGRVAKLVQAKMAALGYNQIEVDAWGNVIGQVQGLESGPTILLDAHMDVVPVTSPQAWQTDPFGAEIAAGRLWGRGAADTKGALAAMVFAVGKMPPQDLPGRVIVVASVCEENLTGAAIGQVIDRFSPDVFITGEPTNLQLGVAQKGRITIQVKANGRSAHTSRPELGDNAVYKMVEAITRMRSTPRPVDPILGPGLLELTEITSEPQPGTSFVPYACQTLWIGRILPGETPETVIRSLREALDGLDAVELGFVEMRQACYTGPSLVMQDFIPGWKNAPDDAWQRPILMGLEAAGLPAVLFGAPCGTNASAAGRLGISSFIYGPGSLAQAHVIDEWVSLTELCESFRGYQAIVRSCRRNVSSSV